MAKAKLNALEGHVKAHTECIAMYAEAQRRLRADGEDMMDPLSTALDLMAGAQIKLGRFNVEQMEAECKGIREWIAQQESPIQRAVGLVQR